MAEEEAMAAEGEAPPPAPDPSTFPWSSAVVFLVGDPGDGSVESLVGEPKLAAAMSGFGGTEGNATLFRRTDVGVVEEGDEAPAEPEEGAPLRPIAEALASLQERMAADQAAGQQRKLEEAAQAEADAAAANEGAAEGAAEGAEAGGEEGADSAEGGAEESAEAEAAPHVQAPDVVYYVCDFMSSPEDAEAVLSSDLSIDAVVNLRIEKRPDPPVLPTEWIIKSRSCCASSGSSPGLS